MCVSVGGVGDVRIGRDLRDLWGKEVGVVLDLGTQEFIIYSIINLSTSIN